MSTYSGTFYLVIRHKQVGWSSLMARLTNKLPSLASGEIAIRLDLSVPRALFTKPQLQASITIPESSVTAPVLDAIVLDNIKEVLSQQLGVDINLTVINNAPSEISS